MPDAAGREAPADAERKPAPAAALSARGSRRSITCGGGNACGSSCAAATTVLGPRAAVLVVCVSAVVVATAAVPVG